MLLNHQIFGEGETLVVLHGLLGSLDNWRTLGKKWSLHFKVVLLDLRNHGFSPHANEMGYPLMAKDIIETVRYLKLSRFHLLGHSMGGKVAMACAKLHCENVSSLTILDIAPKSYSPNLRPILAAMETLDISLESRLSLDEMLTQKVIDVATRQLILKNLRKNKEGTGFTWKINLKAIKDNLSILSDWPDSIELLKKSLNMSALYLGPTQFLIGEKSHYVKKSDAEKVNRLFPHSKIVTIKEAGHWLHAEKPAVIEQLVLNFILGQAQ